MRVILRPLQAKIINKICIRKPQVLEKLLQSIQTRFNLNIDRVISPATVFPQTIPINMGSEKMLATQA